MCKLERILNGQSEKSRSWRISLGMINQNYGRFLILNDWTKWEIIKERCSEDKRVGWDLFKACLAGSYLFEVNLGPWSFPLAALSTRATEVNPFCNLRKRQRRAGERDRDRVRRWERQRHRKIPAAPHFRLLLCNEIVEYDALRTY